MVGTHNWHVWVKHVKQEGVIVNMLFIACKQLIFISYEDFCIPAPKKRISHSNLNIIDTRHQQQVLPL